MLEGTGVVFPLLLALAAGLSTTIGAFIGLAIKKVKFICVAMGFSAGVMIFLSFVQLLYGSVENVGYTTANIFFFAGVFFIMAIDVLIPHKKRTEGLEEIEILVVFGMLIHNFPEGIAILLSSAADISLGLMVAVAIALHNIPGGIIISSPIYKTSHSKRKAILYSSICGMAEPAGAILGLSLLSWMATTQIIYSVLSAVAGVMVFISIEELLPYAFKYGNHHKIALGIFLGMAIMAVSIALL